MSIKQQTIDLIEGVLSQNKPYYKSNEFPFERHRRGCSTYQGAVLRHYLKENGYVNIRVSSMKTQFFIDHHVNIKLMLMDEPLLKPNNTIIMKQEEFEKYKEDYFFKPIGAYKPNPNFKPAIMGIGKEVLPPMPMISNKSLDNTPVIKLLIDKYNNRLNKLKAYYSLNIDDLSSQEASDTEQHIADLAEVVRDLKSI